MTSERENAIVARLRQLKIEQAILSLSRRTDSVDEVTAWVRAEVPDATWGEIDAAFDRLIEEFLALRGGTQ